MALSGRLLLVLNIRQRCWTLQHSFRKTFQAQTFQLLKNQHAAKNAIKYGVVVGASSLGAYWSMRVAQSFSVTTVMAESLAPTAAATVEPDAVMSAILKHKSKPRQQENALSFVRLVIDKLALFLRFTRLSLTFGPLLFLYPFTLINHQLYKLWLKGLFLAMESAGPVFIKLGQWASTRRDLFSKEFCDKFSTLHRKVRPHDWKHTKNALNAAFGKSSKWWKVLKIDEKLPPLGSGCVAQVYKGYVHTSVVEQEVIDALEENETDFDDLCYQDGVPVELPSHDRDEQSADDSQQDSPAELEGSLADYAENPDYIPVAVKVLHPQIRKQFSRDLALMKVMARIMETVIPSLRWVNLIQCVEEFSKTMVKQMDMIHESKCLKRFHRDFANSNCVKVPVPIKSLLARNVLVESFEEGQPISDFLTESADIPRGLKHKLADMGVDALLQMVFVNNFVHGDLHPGNILVQNAHAFHEKPEINLVMVDVGDTMVTIVAPVQSPVRLVLLDCGITATLNPSDREKFTQVFTAVVKGEGETVADLFLEKSAHVECKDPVAFRKEMAEIVTNARETALQLSKIKVFTLLSDVFSMLSRHHVKLESNFATIILAIGILEGLGRSLDPELDILDKASQVLLS